MFYSPNALSMANFRRKLVMEIFVISFITLSIGVAAIGTMGTKAPPDKERNLSIRNQSIEVLIILKGISS